MNIKSLVPLLGLVTAAHLAADPVADALQRGLLAEEIERNPTNAAIAYEAAVRLTADQRAVHAAALYHLAECQRRLGRTNEARENFTRLLRQFPDQARFAELARREAPEAEASSAHRAAEEGPDTRNLQEEVLRAQVMGVRESLQQHERRVRGLEQQINQIQSTSQELRPRLIIALSPNPLIQQLLTELSEAEVRAKTLESSFGPEYPERKSAAAQIQEIHHQLDLEAEGVRETLRIQLNNALEERKRLGFDLNNAEQQLTKFLSLKPAR